LRAERLSRFVSRTWAVFMVLSALTGAIFIYTGPPGPSAIAGTFALLVIATLARKPAARWLAEVWCRRLGALWRSAWRGKIGPWGAAAPMPDTCDSFTSLPAARTASITGLLSCWATVR
jgi:hypothetical protein